MDFLARPSVALLVALCSTPLVYAVGLAIYRLYLSPVSKFPGPKLAALSWFYEIYYEVVLQGQLTFHLQELHKKYGPIIRITPEELHIQDSKYWDELYSRTGRLDKYDYAAGRFGSDSSVFTTPSHSLHAIRRAPLNPMFSRRGILSFQPVVREKVDLLCRKIAEYKDSGKDFSLTDAWTALTGDIITVFSFAECYDHLEIPGFHEPFHTAYMAASEFGHLAVHFPWIHPLMKLLPDDVVGNMQPGLRILFKLRKDISIKLRKIMAGENHAIKDAQNPTIFDELWHSDLPPPEKTMDRLVNEGQTIFGAGLETTAWALSVACYHILANPAILTKLRAELNTAIPDPSAQLDWPTLEKLPYLSACITEAIRLSYGVSARGTRVSPIKEMKYKDWIIPAGTPVSMTAYDVNHDERIFPDSKKYIPERWLGSPKTEDGSPLSRYFVAFGKDTRSCLGINLAYCELYIGLASVFRKFKLELYETDISDVEIKHDFFLPCPKKDSKGVRVKVVAAEGY